MHRCYNSENKGPVLGQGMCASHRKESENTGKDLVRGEKFSKGVIFSYLNLKIISGKNKLERWI